MTSIEQVLKNNFFFTSEKDNHNSDLTHYLSNTIYDPKN